MRSAMFTVRTLREGKWPLLVCALLSVGALACCRWLAVVPLAMLVFTLSFFRDPNPRVPADPRAVVAPAHGRVVEIVRVNEPLFLQSDAMMVAIFLSVFDVHVQQSPIGGVVRLVRHVPGKFLDARHPAAAQQNEHRVIGIAGDDGFGVTVRQVAGLIARRIVGWADTGARLARGQRLGMIRFGSRVEIFLPTDVEITVRVGDHVKGGETVIARRRHA
jgi:phosphatidylserine decarboxylase